MKISLTNFLKNPRTLKIDKNFVWAVDEAYLFAGFIDNFHRIYESIDSDKHKFDVNIIDSYVIVSSQEEDDIKYFKRYDNVQDCLDDNKGYIPKLIDVFRVYKTKDHHIFTLSFTTKIDDISKIQEFDQKYFMENYNG